MPRNDMIQTEQIADMLKKQIESVVFENRVASVGRITATGDGVVAANGLSEAKLGEIVVLPGNIPGLVLNLKENEANIVVLGDYSQLREGDEVRTTGKLMTVTGSYSLLGRVVDGLIRPIDEAGEIKKTSKDEEMLVERIAPGVVARQDVRTPMQTGIKMIDGLVPVGRGQRELIIGDRGIGKTALAIDAIINQANINKNLEEGEKRVISIFVAIGQKQAKVAQAMNSLIKYDAMKDTIIVSAAASDAASMQYLAPFTATAIAEYFMSKGEDVLIVYDDLTKHAWAYRQLSLLLRRPSGREAYPGDIFYLHSRLLERAARMSDANGGGSITALPIIETQAGDISAYIPTNVISITDGQIYLDPDIFYSGARPAVSVGLSVSRVGGDAQMKAIKQVAGKMKLDLAQYRELAAFAQFGSDLDESTQKRLDRGKAVSALLRQNQYAPMPVEQQVASLYTPETGLLDDMTAEEIAEFETVYLEKLAKRKDNVLGKIRKQKKLDEEIEKALAETAKEARWQLKGK